MRYLFFRISYSSLDRVYHICLRTWLAYTVSAVFTESSTVRRLVIMWCFVTSYHCSKVRWVFSNVVYFALVRPSIFSYIFITSNCTNGHVWPKKLTCLGSVLVVALQGWGFILLPPQRRLLSPAVVIHSMKLHSRLPGLTTWKLSEFQPTDSNVATRISKHCWNHY